MGGFHHIAFHDIVRGTLDIVDEVICFSMCGLFGAYALLKCWDN
jgi:hypothetical protein